MVGFGCVGSYGGRMVWPRVRKRFPWMICTCGKGLLVESVAWDMFLLRRGVSVYRTRTQGKTGTHLDVPLTPLKPSNNACRLSLSIFSWIVTVSFRGSKSFSPRLGITIRVGAAAVPVVGARWI